MHDFIEKAKDEIKDYLHNNYEDIKFTVKFNGEFFVVGADRRIEQGESFGNIPCTYVTEISSNRMVLGLLDDWIKSSFKKIPDTELKSENIVFYSQIKRLKKQLEYKLCGGEWGAEEYIFAKKVFYMLHTKSESICLNIVKQCAREYISLQIKGKIPTEITAGYKNALCIVSGRVGS